MMPSADSKDPFRHGLPLLEGATLRLRKLLPSDRLSVYRLYADKEATRYGFSPPMGDVVDADALIAETHRLAFARDIFHWGVARRSDDVVIGHATLLALDLAHHRAEIGFSIVRDLWSRGLGSEAVSVLLRFAFDQLDLRRVEADVDPRNTASLRLLERHGFRREGFMRERWELGGEIQDAIFLGLLRSEWSRQTNVVESTPNRHEPSAVRLRGLA